ncbi:MAG: restriction endonuclease subunit S [Prolixibacteraceae bacterium]|nr:restriction endonuclease subunit S [Prolixibacteraceae bacterium]
MKTTLGHIATIQTGVFAKPVAEGEIVYLQARHFGENGELVGLLHPDLLAEEINEKHLLLAGDVLFSAKGTKNFAALFEDHNPASVASTSFFVLRLPDGSVLPEYLVWYINHPNSQNFLKGEARGTSIPSISKSMLENLEISIPDINTQKLILKIAKLRNREKKLMQQIETLREKQIQQQIFQSIKK